MANTLYKVVLSITGEHSASVESDDPAALTEALIWAKQTHRKLALLAKAPAQQPPEPHTLADGINGQAIAVTEDADPGEPPICEIHQLPMVRMQGKRGAFWSCHERMPDDSFCAYKPLMRP